MGGEVTGMLNGSIHHAPWGFSGMLYVGAGPSTARKMASALQYVSTNLQEEDVSKGFEYLIDDLTQPDPGEIGAIEMNKSSGYNNGTRYSAICVFLHGETHIGSISTRLIAVFCLRFHHDWRGSGVC